MSNSAQDRTLARHPRPLGGDTAKDRRGVQVALSGMVLNNSGPQQLHLGRKPDWLRARVPGGPGYERLREIVDTYGLHTVCKEAACPNMGGMLEPGNRNHHDSW